MEREELVTRLEGLDPRQARRVACALIGHSRVQHIFFGYWSCARCGEQVGDTLGSAYSAAMQAVAVDHHCDHCRENVRTLEWTDVFLLAPEPLQYLNDLRDEALSKRKQVEAKEAHDSAMAKMREYVREREQSRSR